MEDDLKKIRNGRRPRKKNGRGPQKKTKKNFSQFLLSLGEWKTTSKKRKKGRRPKKKKNLFSIPLKFRGTPFLGLAQLSKIFVKIFSDLTIWDFRLVSLAQIPQLFGV
jgi:hypothetical protein